MVGLSAAVAEVKARPAPPLDPLPVMKQFETFEYAAQDMRDPFSQPTADQDGSNALRPDPNRRKEVLEAFPLDSLDMVGTIGSGDGVIGLRVAAGRGELRRERHRHRHGALGLRQPVADLGAPRRQGAAGNGE